MEGEVRVGATDAGNEVVLECANRSLGRVAAVHARGRQLEINFFGEHELFEDCREFIVKSVQFGAKASSDKFGMGDGEGSQNGFGGAIRDGFGMNGVAIEIVEDKQVVVALAGGEDETAGLVAEGLSCGINDSGITLLGGDARGSSSRVEVIVRPGHRLFCRTLVLPGLVEVAFGGCHGIGWMGLQGFECQAGEVGNEVFPEGCFESGDGRGEQ